MSRSRCIGTAYAPDVRQLLLVGTLSLIACGDSGGGPDGGGGASGGGVDGTAGGDGPAACEPAADMAGETPLPADIADIFERNCWMCHVAPTQNDAPFPLETWEDVQRPFSGDTPRYERIGVRIRDTQFPMPPLPRPGLGDEEVAAWPKLDEDEIVTIEGWIADCAGPGE